MYKILICMEKSDYKHFVNICRHYAGNKLSNCYVFSKSDYTTEIYKEKNIKGIDCVIFGWTEKELYSKDASRDLVGIQIEKDNVKNGYIIMEFEDNMLTNYKNNSIFIELEQAMNINKIIKNDFNLVFMEGEQEEEEEFE